MQDFGPKGVFIAGFSDFRARSARIGVKGVRKFDKCEEIKNRIGGGGDFPKRRVDFGCSVTTFSAPIAPKNGNLWKLLGKIGFSDQFFGAAGAKNFDIYRYFGEKSPNFVKVEAFIA